MEAPVQTAVYSELCSLSQYTADIGDNLRGEEARTGGKSGEDQPNNQEALNLKESIWD